MKACLSYLSFSLLLFASPPPYMCFLSSSPSPSPLLSFSLSLLLSSSPSLSLLLSSSSYPSSVITLLFPSAFPRSPSLPDSHRSAKNLSDLSMPHMRKPSKPLEIYSEKRCG